MALGPELLTGGNFETGTGTGAGSVLVGPSSDYIACGPNLFGGSCGAQRYALFTTNAGQVTGGFPNESAITVRGTRSMAVNVSGNLTARIVHWNVYLQNGATYRAGFFVAQMGPPFNIGLRIDGALIASFPGPLVTRIWTRRQTEFVWNGTTGVHNVAFTSNDPTAGGNDHCFDEFSLRTVTPPLDCGCDQVQRVNYRVPNPCAVNETFAEVRAPQLAFTLASNTSGFIITSNGIVGNVPIGSAMPALSNGSAGGDIGLRVHCGGGTPNFANTISATATIAAHDRLLCGLGYWNGWGGILNDGDGLTFNSAELYDGAALIQTQALNTPANSGAFHETLLAAPVAGIDNLRIWAGRKNYGGSVEANASEIAPVWAWEGMFTWACNTTITARVRPVNPLAGPLRQLNPASAGNPFTMTRGGTVLPSGANIVQTNGPHEFLFDVPPGVVGTITTNQPARFSNLNITQAAPTTTLTGNGTQTFDVSWNFDQVGCRPGLLRDGAIFDLATGAEIVNPQLCE